MLMQLSDEVYPLLAPEHKKVEIRADENCKVYGDADKLARIFNNILKMPLPTATRTVPLSFPHGRNHREPLSCSVIRGRPYHRKNSSVFLTNSIGGMKRDRPTAEERVWDLPSQKNWVDLHGGTIRVMSENGRTTFKVCLPRRKNADSLETPVVFFMRIIL